MRRSKRRRTIRFQRGGNPNRPLLDAADAPPIIAQPVTEFNVRFQPNIKAREDGPTYTTYQTAHEPYPVWSAPTPPIQYAIACWDPDVTAKSFLHWLIVNCSGTDNSDGKVLASWSPPSPPPGTGEHRYIIGLFSQVKPIEAPEFTDRTKFNMTQYAQANGLTPLAYRGFRIKAADGPPAAPAAPPAAPPKPHANSVAPLPPPNPV